MKIISGGQTGVDRAALDLALKHGIKSGGWCPAGRTDEFGIIPERYPLQELDRGGFSERTLANVRDSDATIIIYERELHGGTRFTLECCERLQRPHKLINAAKKSAEDAANELIDFFNEQKIRVLNVAGPRQSDWPGGYDFTFRALEMFIKGCSQHPMGRDQDD